MEESRDCKQRKLRRGYERNRLEEELWALAYDQVWPVIRRALARSPSLPPDPANDALLRKRIAVGG